MAERRAVIAGATGLVGRHLLERLLERPEWTRVTTVGRSAPEATHGKLEHLKASLDGFPRALASAKFDDAFCCLGTTMKKAGTKARFRAVDLDGAVQFARAARKAGARSFGLVSAAGASTDSRNFYLQTKGHAEREIETLGFSSLAIARPGVLRGDRAESRPAERLAILAAPLTDRLMIGPLASYRSADARDVADALVAAALAARPGCVRLDPRTLGALARSLGRRRAR